MFEKLVEIICNYVEVEPENVTPESRFMEDLGFTSFDFMSMLGELEDEFDVEIGKQIAKKRLLKNYYAALDKRVGKFFDAALIFNGKVFKTSEALEETP